MIIDTTQPRQQIETPYLEALETLFDRVKTIINIYQQLPPPNVDDKGDNKEDWGGLMFAYIDTASTEARNQQETRNGRITEKTTISRFSSPELIAEMFTNSPLFNKAK